MNAAKKFRKIVVPAYFWGPKLADRRAYLDALDAALRPLGHTLLAIEIGGGDVALHCETRPLPKSLRSPVGMEWRRVPELRHAVSMEAGFRQCSEDEAAAEVLPQAAWIAQVLEESGAALCLLWNQFTGLNRAIAWHCRRLSVPYLYVHLGLLPGTIVFEPGGQMAESWVARDMPRFSQLSVSQELQAKTSAYLKRVREEKWTRKSQATEVSIVDRVTAARAQGRRIIFYAGQNDYRAGILPGSLPEARIHSPWYQSTEDALRDLIALADARNWTVLYKPHPNVQGNVPPPHERLIHAPGANVFECIDHADVTVTLVSQVSYLALIQRRPVVILGRFQLSGTGAAYEIARRGDTASRIAQALEAGHTPDQQAAFERHAAQLLEYYLFAYDAETEALIGRRHDTAAGYLRDQAQPGACGKTPLTLIQVTEYAPSPGEGDALPEGSAAREHTSMGWKSVVTRPFARIAAMSGSLLRHILSDPAAQARLAHDPSLLRLLFRPESALWNALRNPDVRRRSGFEEGLLEAIGSKALLDQMDEEMISKFLGNRLRDGKMALDDIVPRVGYGLVIEYLCEKAESGVIQPLDVLDMLLAKENGLLTCLVGGENTRQALVDDGRFQKLVLHELLHDDNALKQLLGREEVVRRILNSQHLRNRIRFIHAREMAGRLPYRLPAVVVSYPRAGSNFLQNILKHSSGLHSQSIYGPYPFSEPKEVTLTVKSHAVSPAYLVDEFRRLVEVDYAPERIVLLQRDPRDLMISFYEYAQTNRQTEIRQDEFLDGIDFFYASTIDPQARRTVEKNPLTVAQAFRKHVQTWFRERPEHPPCLVVRYEELVQDPWAHFQRIFDFLQLDCTLAEEFLRVKVSLHAGTRDETQRGRAGGWRGQQEKYGVLLHQVQRDFAEEIRLLGYDRE